MLPLLAMNEALAANGENTTLGTAQTTPGAEFAAVLPSDDLRKLREAIAVGDTLTADEVLKARSKLQVEINPETRVAVEDLGAPAGACPEDPPWIIRIVNYGYATSHLNVAVAPTQGISAQIHDAKLSGQRVEYRLLKISSSHQGPVEVVLSISAGQATIDLGGRSRIPLLLDCR